MTVARDSKESAENIVNPRRTSSLLVIAVLAAGLMLPAAALVPVTAASVQMLPNVAFPPALSSPPASTGTTAQDPGNFVCNSHGFPKGAPACWPMGVADYGVNPSNDKAYSYKTSADQAWITINSINIGRNNCGNVCGGGEDAFTLQQNDVEVVSTNTGPQSYWTQDVPFVFYYPQSQTFSVTPLDNIWNFSGAFNVAGNMTAVSGNLNKQCVYFGGAPVFYYCEAPAVNNLKLPLTIGTEIQTFKQGKSSYVTFWMQIESAGKVVYSSTYDKIQFTNGPSKTAPQFLVAACLPKLPFNQNNFGKCSVGNKASPFGLPYDAEWIFGGPADGSQVRINSISAQMSEYYWNAGSSTFVSVPHAWSNGWDTAEGAGNVHMTSSGSPTATASGGKDNVLQGLW